jgi:hypothetical protein
VCVLCVFCVCFVCMCVCVCVCVCVFCVYVCVCVCRESGGVLLAPGLPVVEYKGVFVFIDFFTYFLFFCPTGLPVVDYEDKR